MISVCMATYNGEKYIKEQVQSILMQLSKEDELIISDDLSTDRTLEIIKGFNDERIKIYIHEKEHGFVKNFENALKKASGDFVFLSDQDDLWLPNKISKTMELLKEYDFVVSDCVTVDDKDNIISESRVKDYKISTGFWRLMIKTRYLGCCMAFRKNVLKAVLPFPNNVYLMEHDLWIAAISEAYFKTSIINEPLVQYRRHTANASSGGIGQGYPIYIKIIRRIYRLICVGVRWFQIKRTV